MRGMLVLLGLAGLMALAMVPNATATTEGPCTGSIRGVDVATLSASDPAKALKVGADEVVPYTFAVTDGTPVVGHRTFGLIGPYELELQHKTEDGDQSTSSGTFEVSQVSNIATGVYAVTTEIELADGRTCTGHYLIHVEGSVFDSPVGLGSLGLALLSGGGMVAVGVKTATGVKTMMASFKLV